MDSLNDWIINVLVALAALVGGIARLINELLTGDRKYTILTAAGHIFVSGWSGFVAAQIISVFDPSLAFAVAGVSGWMGSKSLELLQGYLTKRFGP